jgi:hypothetical protein
VFCFDFYMDCQTMHASLDEATAFLDEVALRRTAPCQIFTENFDSTTLFQQSRTAIHLIKCILTAQAEGNRDVDQILNALLLFRCEALSKLCRIQVSAECAKPFIEQCNNAYSLLFKRAGGVALPSWAAWRDFAMLTTVTAMHNDDPAIYQRSITTIQVSNMTGSTTLPDHHLHDPYSAALTKASASITLSDVHGLYASIVAVFTKLASIERKAPNSGSYNAAFFGSGGCYWACHD